MTGLFIGEIRADWLRSICRSYWNCWERNRTVSGEKKLKTLDWISIFIQDVVKGRQPMRQLFFYNDLHYRLPNCYQSSVLDYPPVVKFLERKWPRSVWSRGLQLLYQSPLISQTISRCRLLPQISYIKSAWNQAQKRWKINVIGKITSLCQELLKSDIMTSWTEILKKTIEAMWQSKAICWV